MFTEPPRNSPELLRPFRDVSALNVLAVLHDETLDFLLKLSSLLHRKRNLTLPLAGPYQRSIKCLRRNVSGQKRNGIEARQPGRSYGRAKVLVIRFLNRSAACDDHVRLPRTNLSHTPADQTKRITNPPDRVMNLARAVNRNDYLIEQPRNFFRTFDQQQPCRQKGKTNVLLTKKPAKSVKIVVQQRLTAGQHHLPHPELAQRYSMAIQIGHSHLLVRLTLPDITHDTAAVAVSVDIQNENRYLRQSGGLQPGR